MKPSRDDGYAAASAMLAAAAFALIAAQVARTSRSEVQSAAADAVKSRLQADVDAGLALTLANLVTEDALRRWRPQDAPRTLSYDGAELSITVEADGGKIPLNTIDRTQVETMFRAAGASPERAAELRGAFLDWRDPQRADRTGPPDPDRPGGFSSIYELQELAGMDAALFHRLAASVTVSRDVSSFSADAASPLALQVMQGADASSVKGIERARELAGERTALSTASSPGPLTGSFTVRIRARDPAGDSAARSVSVELTGSKLNPILVRGAAPLDSESASGAA